MKMNKKLTKRILAVALSAVVALTTVFTGTPVTANAAAAKTSITSFKSVKAENTVNYVIKNLKKGQFAKVTFTGTAKSNVLVERVSGAKIISKTTKIKGTDNTITLKVKATKAAVGKSFGFTVRTYTSKGKWVSTTRTKNSAKVYVSATAITLDKTTAALRVGETATLTATLAPAESTQKITWLTSDATIATVANGVVTAVKAGKATITAKCGEFTATCAVTVSDVAVPAITSILAKKVNTLEVTFASPVNTTDVTLAVTRGTNVIPGAITWNADKTVATIVTTAKMTKGTYTVTATSKEAKKDTNGTVEILDQYAAKIELLNKVALTFNTEPLSGGSKKFDAMGARAYYDIVDQYGESMRTSATIEWSASCKVFSVDKNTGMIVLKRTDDKQFTYNEQIYLTGVYSKTGISVNATLTVGAAQALNEVKVAGFVKKGTTTMLKSLPAGFKSDEYFMAYQVLDQNGNPMDNANTYVGKDVTFISENVMVIKELITNGAVKTIDGISYSTVAVTPGIKVGDGGEVNITAIANKTGNKTKINVVVGQDAILTSFNMSSPTAIISDDTRGTIPFTALDQNGKAITNFVTLAKQATFNTLTFTCSEGTLTLSEQNDGTAALVYTDKIVDWSDSASTDGIDRTISLTSVVVGGNSCNQLIYISDKARPDAISAVNPTVIPNVAVEGATITINLDSFSYIDQYGRPMGAFGQNNGFFAAGSSLKGIEFAGYEFGVKATYVGNGGVNYVDASDNNKIKPLPNNTPVVVSTTATSGSIATATGQKYFAATNVLSAKSGEGFKFELAKVKTGNATGKLADWATISTAKQHSMTVVDITQVKNMAIKDLNKFYVQTANTDKDVFTNPGNAFGGYLAALDQAVVSDAVGTGNDATGEHDKTEATVGGATPLTYQQEVMVSGTYNGAEVNVPANYFMVGGDFLSTTALAFNETNALGENKIDSMVMDLGGTPTNSKLKWSDLYSKVTANFTRKDATDNLKASIREIYYNADNGGNKLGDAIAKASCTTVVDTATKRILISDATPIATKIVTSADAYTTKATTTVVTNAGLKDTFGLGGYAVLDQYGFKMATETAAITFKISNIKENEAGYASNNFTVAANDGTTCNIAKGAERGDTFTLTLSYGNFSKEVKMTVGADGNAKIDSATGNVYLNTLINGSGGLEEQRIAGLN